MEKFKTRALSITHREAVMKFQLLQQPPISNHLDVHAKKCQTSRRNALLKQLNAIKFLLRQGIAMRGHDETEGNLYQLLIMLSNDCPDVKSYVREKKYMSHEIVDEQISLMANRLLRSLLTAISENNPA